MSGHPQKLPHASLTTTMVKSKGTPKGSSGGQKNLFSFFKKSNKTDTPTTSDDDVNEMDTTVDAGTAASEVDDDIEAQTLASEPETPAASDAESFAEGEGDDDEESEDDDEVEEEVMKKKGKPAPHQKNSAPDASSLPPINDIGAIFADLVGQIPKLKNVAEHIKGRKLRVATMCSGTESPLLALELIQKSLKEQQGVQLEVEHVFSCEIEPFKQAYIERNFQPPLLFRDVCELGDGVACVPALACQSSC